MEASIMCSGFRSAGMGKLVAGLLLAAFVAVGAAGLCLAKDPPADDSPWFVNVAKDVGLSGKGAQRVLWLDLNGDGWLDCILQKEFVFLNVPDPEQPGRRIFREITDEAGLTRNPLKSDEKRVSNLIVAGDVDNDGDIDLFSGMYCDFQRWETDPKTGERLLDSQGNHVFAVPDNGLRSEILLNDGAGHFTIAQGSGVEESPATTSAACFLDYDCDGCLDLFVGNWYSNYGWSMEAYQDRLYRGDGSGKFTDVTDSVGLTTRKEPGAHASSKPTYGCSHTDWNNDGWQDILVAVYGRQWNMLWENLAGNRLRDEAGRTHFDGDADRSGWYPEEIRERLGEDQEPPYRSNGNTFDCPPADFDNDGDIDVFLGEITHWWAGPSSDLSSILVNQGPQGDYVFERRPDLIPRTHTDKAWNQGDLHAGWLDFDNDGLLDLLIASGDYPDGQYLRLFKQKADHTFEDVTDRAGFDWEGCGGISLGDFDRDGDVDILVGKSFARLPKEKTEGKIPEPALFENRVGNQNNWLTVLLRGKGASGANVSAIGARVILKCGDLVQTRELYGSLGHAGHQDALEVHFGLGQHGKIDSLEVVWPNKDHTHQMLTDVPVNSMIQIVEGREGFISLK
jgi:hypothetical protein